MPKVKMCRDPSRDATDRALDQVYGIGVNARTYKQLSDASGIPASTLRKCRTQSHDMPVSRLVRLMRAIGATDEDWLYIWTGKRK